MTPRDARRAIAVAALAAILATGLAALAPQVPGGAVALAADPTASLAATAAATLAATAAATAADRGDLRSPGEGAGIVGAPLLAIGTVLLIGLASAGATVVYVRLTRDRQGTAGR